MSQHHSGTQDHSSWVCLSSSHNVLGNVSATRFVEGIFSSNVASWNRTWSSDQSSADVSDDVSVKVWHDHDIELLRSSDKLHRAEKRGKILVSCEGRKGAYVRLLAFPLSGHSRVINDHIPAGDSRTFVFLSNLSEGVQEETISQLHDVGLVNTGDLLSSVLQGKVESEP